MMERIYVKYYNYIRYILRHKWYVFIVGLKYKVPIWQLLVHDLSKFLPSEFFPYMEYFYGARNQEKFDRAWNYHQKRNKHHWQYWTYTQDSGATITIEMPEKYRREMLADWDGAGIAKSGKADSKNWYIQHKDIYQFHPKTRALVEKDLNI